MDVHGEGRKVDRSYCFTLFKAKLIGFSSINAIRQSSAPIYPHFTVAAPDLRERGKVVVILCNVGIEDRAIMLCHFQRAMSHQLLERKRIATAIN